MAILNSEQVNWTIKDYLNFYVARQYPEYIKLKALVDECDHLMLGHILKIWEKKNKEYTGQYGVFYNGQYELPQKAIDRIKMVNQVMECINNNVRKDDIRSYQQIVLAVKTLSSRPKYSQERMLRQIEVYPFLFRAQGRIAQYVNQLIYIYDYNSRNKGQLLQTK